MTKLTIRNAGGWRCAVMFVTLASLIAIPERVFPAQQQSNLAQPAKRITAREIIRRIQEHVGVPWHGDTVDTLKAGDPDTPVAGIAVTMMATMDVLQRAAASGKNLIITHEPTFYDHLDKAADLEAGKSDPVLAAKRSFIKDHSLVVWRFHDYWHRRTPDGILEGMKHALGWDKFQDPAMPYVFTLPDTTVQALAADLTQRLGIHVLRVVGDPNLAVKRVALVPGSSGANREIRALEMPDVQVLVTGEPREWETVEYVADAASQGRAKALIILSHIPSEQAGMQECARWLETFVTEVPVEFIPTPDPFWRMERAKP